MNRKLITAACLALILTGCGDKNDSATVTDEPGMMEKTMDTAGEMATDAAEGAGEMTTGAVDAVNETASDVAEGTSEMASDMVDAAEEEIHDAAQGVADATAPEVEDAATDAAEDAMDNTGGAMGQ